MPSRADLYESFAIDRNGSGKWDGGAVRPMNARDYVNVAKRHWWIILLTTVLIGGWATVTSFAAAPSYRSTGTVYVSLPFGNTPAELSQGALYTQSQMESYAALVSTSAVLDPVIAQLNLDTTSRELSNSVSAEAKSGTVLLDVSAAGGTPEQARQLAQAVSASFIREASKLAPPDEKGEPSVNIAVVEEPQTPQFAFAPNKRRNIAAGLLAGVIIGYLLALLRDVLDTRVKSVADIRDRMSAVVLAEVPRTKTPEVVGKVGEPYHTAVDRLRAGLDFLEVDSRPLQVTVTSPRAGEGKTTTAINLARSCAEAGQRVLLIDADLRRPRIHEVLGLDQSVGLTTVLAGRQSPDTAIQRGSRDGNLSVLTSGQVPPNPSKLLASSAMASLLQLTKQEFDLVVIDTPPVLPVVDAAVVSRQVSGALLVVRLGQVRYGDVDAAVESMEEASARVLGVVANGVPKRELGQMAYYSSRM